MSKTLGFVAAAAMLVSVTAFAQNSSSSAPSSDAAPAASAPSDSSAPADGAKAPKTHKHHRGMTSMNKAGTDHDADKLNACMSNATPTDAQEQCLKQASS